MSKHFTLENLKTILPPIKTLIDKIEFKADKEQITPLEEAISLKLDKENPNGSGSFSLNRSANTVIGEYSVAEGYNTTASGKYSHAEGLNTTASGNNSHAEGYNTTASGYYSHAEGNMTEASGMYSHAEGHDTKATKSYSHAEGASTTASGQYSHAEGNNTTALANESHAEGYGTIARGNYSHVEGKCNIEDTENKYVHIVGNGDSVSARSNAHTLDWDGNAWFQGTIKVGGISQYDSNAKEIAFKSDIPDTSDFITAIPDEYITETELNEKGYLTEILTLTDAEIDEICGTDLQL